jgi:hypothetical protein
MEEVEFAVGLVGEAVARLRELSPTAVVGRKLSYEPRASSFE